MMELSFYPRMVGLGDGPCGSGQYAVYSDAQGHYDPTVTPVCKACPTLQTDPLFPNGCPSGFTSTPFSGPLGGCTEYECRNAAGVAPLMAANCGGTLAGGMTPTTMLLLGAGVLGIAFDQLLLGILAIGAGLLAGLGTHMQADIDPTTGAVICRSAVTSW